MCACSRTPTPLPDVRTPEDAAAVIAALHDRVQALRQALPAQVRLEGSLAGGRKTMSAALQTAFELQARPGDRLTHVLVHPAIEADQVAFREFRLPGAQWVAQFGVEEAAQVRVYDVPFTRLRTFVRDPALRRALDAEPYAALWPRLQARPVRAVVAWEGLVVTLADGEAVRVRLTGAAAELYAAIAGLGEGWHRAEAVGRAIEALGWTKQRSIAEGSDWDKGADALPLNRLAQRKRDLKGQLEELARRELDTLIPERRKDGDFRLIDAAIVTRTNERSS